MTMVVSWCSRKVSFIPKPGQGLIGLGVDLGKGNTRCESQRWNHLVLFNVVTVAGAC